MKVNQILIFIILIISLGFLNNSGKDRQTFIPIKSIDPKETNFSDFEPLKKLIGDKRIVLLGEQNHGDGSSMLAKTRLIKFLHEEMGFNTLAMETSLYTGKKLNESKLLQDSTQYWTNLRIGLMKVWAHSAECSDLWNYIWRHNELSYIGFDSQTEDDFAREYFIQDFISFLDDINLDNTKYNDFLKTLEIVVDVRYTIDPQPVNEMELKKFVDDINMLIDEVQINCSKGTTSKNCLFYTQWLINARDHQVKTRWLGQKDTRDSLMYNNLVWLCEKYYPKEKIICWGATSHFIKNPSQIDTQMDDFQYKEGYKTAGNLLFKKYDQSVYIIGTTEFSGVTSRGPWPKGMGWKIDTLSDSSPGSLEAIIHNKDLEYAFINLHSYSDNKPYLSRTIGTVEMNANWKNHLDGIIYIDEMKPNTRNAFWH